MSLLQSIDPELVRFLTLMLPAVAALALLVGMQFQKRVLVAVFMNVMWCISSLFVLNIIAIEIGWWSFNAETATLDRVPIDIILGWSFFWGACLYPLFRRFNILWLIACVLIVDVTMMPAFPQLYILGDAWLVGEAVVILFGLIPGFYLARFTEADRHVQVRGFLQAIFACILLLFIIPISVLEYTQVDWREIFALSTLQKNILANLLLIPVIFGWSANQEFASVGRGTPIPFDPPKQLVRTGVYAYLANPMQVSLVWVFSVLAISYQSLALASGVLMTLAYCFGIVRIWNSEHIAQEFPQEWKTYKANVRNWFPRFRPYIPVSAELFLSPHCEICQSTKRFFEKRRTTGLLLRDATEYAGDMIDRSTYVHPDGFEETGVKAIARSLEHINLLFAFYAWLMRLPGVSHMLQFLLDKMAQRGAVIYPQRQR